jgi:4-hydroxythreonine-4-phosphate dehydrogenase
LLGDHGGIGPEIVVKLLSHPEEIALADVIVIGERWAFEDAHRALGVEIHVSPITSSNQMGIDYGPAFLETNFLEKNELMPARPTAASGAAGHPVAEIGYRLGQAGQLRRSLLWPFEQASHALGRATVPGRVEVL